MKKMIVGALLVVIIVAISLVTSSLNRLTNEVNTSRSPANRLEEPETGSGGRAGVTVFSGHVPSTGQQLEWDKPATLNGIFHKGKFEDCCENGNSVEREYTYVSLVRNADIISGYNDEAEPTLRGVRAIQLDSGGIGTFGEGQQVNVACSQLWYGNTGHYALPAYCKGARIQIISALENGISTSGNAGPNVVQVVAKGVSVVPGAIVCPDLARVQLLFDQYAEHWEESMQDQLTRGQSKLLRGEATPDPDPDLYGCALLTPGTQMNLERGNIVPVVSARRSDGSTIRGVTLPAMITQPK